jgi:NTP pyrophosphatase (non-canonical NTP hydrolase)
MNTDHPYFSKDLNTVAVAIVHWRARKGFDTHWKNCPEKLMLVVTELGEAMEAYRHLHEKTLNMLQGGAACGQLSLYADQIPKEQQKVADNFAEEIADTFIRLLDMTGSLGINIAKQIAEKMATNEKRPHKHGKEC